MTCTDRNYQCKYFPNHRVWRVQQPFLTRMEWEMNGVHIYTYIHAQMQTHTFTLAQLPPSLALPCCMCACVYILIYISRAHTHGQNPSSLEYININTHTHTHTHGQSLAQPSPPLAPLESNITQQHRMAKHSDTHVLYSSVTAVSKASHDVPQNGPPPLCVPMLTCLQPHGYLKKHVCMPTCLSLYTYMQHAAILHSPHLQHHLHTYTHTHTHTYTYTQSCCPSPSISCERKHTCLHTHAHFTRCPSSPAASTREHTHTHTYINTQSYAPPLISNSIYTSGPPMPTVLHTATLGSLLPMSPVSAPQTPSRHIIAGTLTQHNSPHGALNTSDYMQNQHVQPLKVSAAPYSIQSPAAPYSIQSPARSLIQTSGFYEVMQVQSLNV
jgi:hypothetical protein